MHQKSLPVTRIPLPTPWPTVGPVHAYLFRLDPVTLLDTGLHTPESRDALLTGLRNAGVALTDIKRVLITHAHLDHMGQAAWIQAESGAEVWLHPDETGKAETPLWWIEGREQALVDAGVPAETRALTEQAWQRNRQMAILPLQGWTPMADGQRLEFEFGALEAVHLPGHALGHTGFFDRQAGALYGGDHLLVGVTPNPVMEPVPIGHLAAVPHAPHRALTLGQFLQALLRVRDLPVRRVEPGHGPEILDHITVVDTYIAKHERRLGLLYNRLQSQGGMTVHAVTREVFPRVKEFDIFLALSEIMAHLDLLAVRGRAAVEPGPAGTIYRALP